jgi:hypothetical protein
VIVTDVNGRPFEKPRRVDYASDLEFARAFHTYRDRVTAEANRAFDGAFRAALGSRKVK